jgi:nitronate monooxygenase
VRQIATTVHVPVLAAGGIMDGAGIAAALALGAEGAQLGTAFITSSESLASEDFRQRLQQGAPVQTTVTAAISGRAARGLENSLSRAVDALSARVPDYPIAYDATKALVAAAAQRGADYAVQWCGQGGGFNRALPAAELVEQLGRELEQELTRLRSLV